MFLTCLITKTSSNQFGVHPLAKIQPENFFPRTSQGRPPPTSLWHPLKILFDHPGDFPIWCPGKVSKWRPGDVLIRHPRDVPGRLIRDVSTMFSGHPLDDLENMPWGQCGVTCWMSLNIFLLFFRNLLDWPNLSKHNSILKVYLEPSRTSQMEVFFAKLGYSF